MEEMSSLERDRLMQRFGRTFTAGEILFREADPGTEAFLLQQGRVRLTKSIHGVDRSLMILRAGDWFGESVLLPGGTRSSTAIALSDGSAIALEQATVFQLLSNQPGVAVRMVNQLLRRLRDAQDQIELMTIHDPQTKVVAALLKVAHAASENEPSRPDTTPLLLSVSPLELSTRIGLEVDAVKRVVQRLREGNYVRIVDEQLEVSDLDALRKLYSLLGVRERIVGRDESSTRGEGPSRSS